MHPVFGEIIGAIILGIIAGYLARLLVPGKQDIGFLMTVALGIAGAIVGYFFFTELLGIGDDDKFDLGGLLGAVVGAIILLLIYIKFVHPSTGDRPAAVDAGDREDRQRDRDRERVGRGGRRDREPR
jgi:uncharacterized membrane protein YeaQ/YmgE (transglycosylase-associated protein family)